MPKTREKSPSDREGKAEKAGRWYRNFNAAVGAVALGGAAIVAPPAAAVLTGYAAFNFVQAGGGEWVRRHAKRKREKKQKPA